MLQELYWMPPWGGEIPLLDTLFMWMDWWYRLIGVCCFLEFMLGVMACWVSAYGF
jgi:hypothetical protein